ncbi:hypothetical protein TBLA_0B00870 [Henningerozyma blattae CBS 6284]|uniref:oxaloacetate tautomerase n=1 Tax=Henningerozyma blattae (strain ATCC 34711 / CBS 6284 / DSM 70876 / NBRC 10599 / NRRL Y-10934 / UCD 77-7) TaxID=1071380 RepID=I2GXS8_HENB6|nr:hypothetical protein TBLA_0B00870 [Tetrapisispora blattae CBS 6284]CCH58930.1 hypothetical protein TBLA_0B00870 [Tetrapisispora blattae CBS 6284]
MNFEYIKTARKVICIGRNYAAHIKELNNKVPKQPFFFLKPTSSIITPISADYPCKQLPDKSSFNGFNSDGSNPGNILIPNGTIVHHETELAVVMDKYVSNELSTSISNENVWDYIRGVSLALDLTARNVQDEAKKKGLPWSIGKGFDTFLPISGYIPKETLLKTTKSADLQNSFRLKCYVNGELRQDGTTDLMLNPLPKIIQHISTMITLEPGDIVLTGTPSGVGEIHNGDVIVTELFLNDVKLTDMKYDCKERPGPYKYIET